MQYQQIHFIFWSDGTINNVIVSNYSDLDELKDALICSCYLPGFSSWKQGWRIYQGRSHSFEIGGPNLPKSRLNLLFLKDEGPTKSP